MKMVKSLILGSAAGLIAMSGAQAADLPVKAKAVEYVRICSLYGAGFYYIPGTDTCIKLGGYLRADVTLNGSGNYNEPNWAGGSAASQGTRARNEFTARSREDLNIDTRTATEYGVVRTFFDATFSFGTGDGVALGDPVGVYFAFVQFAGFTFGKAASQYSTPWFAYPGNQGSYLIGTQSDETGVNQIAYTAQFGGGVSASISVEDPTNYDQTQLINATTMLTAANQAGIIAGNPTGAAPQSAGGYGGTVMPDVIGAIRVDQAWGLFQLSGALHDIHSLYYGATEATGHPNDAYGGAVQVGLSIKNIPTGPGDTINMTAGYANGAAKYIIGGVGPVGFGLFGGTSVPGAYQSIAFATDADGIFGAGTGISKTNTYGFQGAFTHNWDPHWATAIFGGYAAQRYGSTGTALYCAGMAAAIAGQGVTYTCNPNFDLSQIGSYTSWTPVKNLTFSAEVMYSYIKQNMSGTAAIATPGGLAPAATYAFGNQGTVSGLLRVQRVF
jgi:hypothetical protein